VTYSLQIKKSLTRSAWAFYKTAVIPSI